MVTGISRLALPLAAAAFLTFGAAQAEARVFVGVGVGVAPCCYAPYYAPYAYYPPYYSPYAYGYPPPYPYAYPGAYPGYGAPPPAAAAPTPAQSAEGEQCRQYGHSVVIDGVKQPAHGTACRQPDGTWKLVD